MLITGAIFFIDFPFYTYKSIDNIRIYAISVAEIKYFKPRQKRANEIKEKMKKNKQAGT